MKIKKESVDYFFKEFLGVDTRNSCSTPNINGMLVPKRKALLSDENIFIQMDGKTDFGGYASFEIEYGLVDFDDLHWKLKEVSKKIITADEQKD